MAELIEGELVKFESPDDVEIFFSAHGVPKSYVEEFGDPYKEEIEQCVGMIMERLKQQSKRNNSHTLAYQSRVGPVHSLTNLLLPDFCHVEYDKCSEPRHLRFLPQAIS